MHDKRNKAWAEACLVGGGTTIGLRISDNTLALLRHSGHREPNSTFGKRLGYPVSANPIRSRNIQRNPRKHTAVCPRNYSVTSLQGRVFRYNVPAPISPIRSLCQLARSSATRYADVNDGIYAASTLAHLASEYFLKGVMPAVT